jgi:hypothetical protein
MISSNLALISVNTSLSLFQTIENIIFSSGNFSHKSFITFQRFITHLALS